MNAPMNRTRIKICGITRQDDLLAAAMAGADAVGFVFYRPSPRYVAPDRVLELVRRLPPMINRVGLFVNESPAVVHDVLARVQIDTLQFHGDEDAVYCRQFGLPWIKAARVRPDLDLLEYASAFSGAAGLLLDAYVEGYGGAGETFDWSLIPKSLPVPIILSGGLTPQNVGEAVRVVRPWAVDVSSGVEAGTKGIKDAQKIAEFISGVRDADARRTV